MHFTWQTILTGVSPPFQKTIYNFKLVVGHTTKHMKHGRSCDIEIWWSSIKNVARGRSPSATFSTSGSSYFNVHWLPCIICIMSNSAGKRCDWETSYLWVQFRRTRSATVTLQARTDESAETQPWFCSTVGLRHTRQRHDIAASDKRYVRTTLAACRHAFVGVRGP